MYLRVLVVLGLGAFCVFGLAWAYQSMQVSQAVEAQRPLLDEGRYDEALARLEAALKVRPQNPELWEAKGRVLMLWSRFRFDPAERQKMQEDSAAAFGRSIALDPLNARRMTNRIEAYLRFDQPTAALAAVPEALRRDPNNAGLHYYKGRALQQLGRLDEARVAYQTSDRIAPGSDGARGLRSLAAKN